MSFKKLVPPDFELEILPPSQDLITKHISLINTLDKQMQFQGLCGLRKLLLTDSPDIAQGIINSGIVPVLLKLLDRDGEKRLQFLSSWIIRNLCTKSKERIESMITMGIFDSIVRSLGSNIDIVVEQAIMTLTNVIDVCPEYRSQYLEKNYADIIIEAVLRFPNNESIKKNTTKFLYNLFRPKITFEWKQVSKIMPFLKQIIQEGDLDDALSNALWCLSWISVNNIQQVIDFGYVPLLLNHLQCDEFLTFFPALRVLANLVAGNDNQTNVILSHADFLPRVFELLSYPDKRVRKEACWLISNLTAGNEAQIELIISNSQYLEALKKTLFQDIKEVSIEASWAFCNLASEASPNQISKLITEHNYLTCLDMILTNPDTRIKEIALEAILNAVQTGKAAEVNPYLKEFSEIGLIEVIQVLVKNEKLSPLAKKILDNFEKFDEIVSKSDFMDEENLLNKRGYYIENNVYVQFIRED